MGELEKRRSEMAIGAGRSLKAQRSPSSRAVDSGVMTLDSEVEGAEIKILTTTLALRPSVTSFYLALYRPSVSAGRCHLASALF